MRVILRHVSNVPGSAGGPGDEVTVNDELGQRWLDSKGADRLDEDDTTPAPEPVRDSEPIVEKPAETPKPSAGHRRKKAAKRRS